MPEDDALGLFKELFGEPPGNQREASAGASVARYRIPGYEVLGLLGKGGMGVVVKARQTSLDRMVALKLMSAELSRDPEYVQRFQLEARTAGRLRHLNIVSALDCGVVKESRFMVMELVEGKSLDRVLKERGMLDERVALGIIKQVAEGLEYAWKHGIIHRDIKPQNIMMTSEGVAKICDLGLAKSVRKDSKLTSTGYVNCTPTHASPEQAKGDRELDCRTDIYSLGITFYQLVTGRLPFEGNAPGDYFIKHATAPRIPPSERNPRVSRRVNDLILRMIEPEAERRPKTPGAVIDAIREILSNPEKPSSAPPAPAAKEASLPGPSILALAGVREDAAWDLAVSQRDGCAVVRLSGRLDDTFDQVMTRRLTDLVNTRVHRIIVDLSGLRYMNSRGVSAFIAVVDEIRQMGGDLKMAGAKPQAKLVLERLGISLIIQHLETVEEAVEAFKTTPIYSANSGSSSEEVITLPPEMILGIERAAVPASMPAVPESTSAPVAFAGPAVDEAHATAPQAPAPETKENTAPLPTEASPAPPEALGNRADQHPTARKGKLVWILAGAILLLGATSGLLGYLLVAKGGLHRSTLKRSDQVLRAEELKATGTSNVFAQTRRPQGGTYWRSESAIRPELALQNFVEGDFIAKPGVRYRAWAYVGGKTRGDVVIFYQVSEGVVPQEGGLQSISPGQSNAAKLVIPPSFGRHTETGMVWGWAEISLPEVFKSPGIRSIRLLTDRGDVAVRYLLVSPNATQEPSQDTVLELEAALEN